MKIAYPKSVLLKEKTIGQVKKQLEKYLGVRLNDFTSQLKLDPSDILFWSGSLVEGFGNKKSDVDLYVIGNTNKRESTTEITGPGFPTMERLLLRTQSRIDVTFIPHTLIRAIGDYLSQFQSIDYVVDWSDNLRELVHRFKIGIPIVNVKQFEHCQRQINFDRYRSYLIHWYQKRMDSLLDDVLGAVETNDIHTALFCSRTRLRLAFDLYLAAKGETNTRCDKWRWQKLMRLHKPNDPMVRQYLLCEGISAKPVNLRTQLKICRQLTENILLDVI